VEEEVKGVAAPHIGGCNQIGIAYVVIKGDVCIYSTVVENKRNR